MKIEAFPAFRHDGNVNPIECDIMHSHTMGRVGDRRVLPPHGVTATGSSLGAWSIILFTVWLAGIVPIAAAQAELAAAADVQPTIEHYRLELVAFRWTGVIVM